jgi:hypothetical protein
VVGAITPLLSIWVTRWWSNGEVLLRASGGAVVGFLGCSLFEIVRKRSDSLSADPSAESAQHNSEIDIF